MRSVEPAFVSTYQAAEKFGVQIFQRPFVSYILRHRDSEKTALRCEGQSMSYQSLVCQASGMAAVLRDHFEVDYGTKVALLLPKSVDWVLTMLSLNMIGAPYTLLDDRMEERARQHVWQTWEPRVVICDQETDIHDFLLAPKQGFVESDRTEQGQLQPSVNTSRPLASESDLARFVAAHVVSMATLKSRITEGRQLRPDELNVRDTESFAFIDWTSGTSSGKPKGTMMWHKHLTNSLLWRWSTFPMFDVSPDDPKRISAKDGKDDVCAINLFGLWYWWYPLCMGCTTLVIPDYMLIDHESLIHYLAHHKVTRWDCTTPTLMKSVLLYLPDQEEVSRPPSALEKSYAVLREKLKVVVLSGEAVHVSLLRLAREKLPQTRCVHRMLSVSKISLTRVRPGTTLFVQAIQSLVNNRGR